MTERESLLPRMNFEDCQTICRHFENMGHDYWWKSHFEITTPPMVGWYQLSSAIMYGEARRVRAWVLAHPELRR